MAPILNCTIRPARWPASAARWVSRTSRKRGSAPISSGPRSRASISAPSSCMRSSIRRGRLVSRRMRRSPQPACRPSSQPPANTRPACESSARSKTSHRPYDPKPIFKVARFPELAEQTKRSPRASWLPRRDPGRVGSFEEQAVDTVALTLEIGEHVAVEFPRAGELDPHRIDEMAIHYDFVMEMRPGREAGLTEITDDLALPHMGAFDRPAGKPRHVIIGRDVAVGVLNLDATAIT